MSNPSPTELHSFIVRAKAATYVGGGDTCPPCRPQSHDLKFNEGSFAYLDSYFGGADFIGEEVVYFDGNPVWAMNYYGRILEPVSITPAETGQIIQKSLSQMYRQGRFLGGFENTIGDDTYVDTSQGEVDAFTGKERILRNNKRVYELVYHGGLIK